MKKIIKSILLILAGITLLAVGAVSIYRIDEVDKTSRSKEKKRQPITVGVVSVKKGPVRQWVVGEGTARTVHRQMLNFRTSGRVIFITKDEQGIQLREGTDVSGPALNDANGQLLARLDDKQQMENLKLSHAILDEAKQNLKLCQNELQKTELRFSIARKQMERADKLLKKKIISTTEYETEKANYFEMVAMIENANIQVKLATSQIKKAKIQLAQAKLELNKTRLYAPFDGVISYLNIKLGDYFSPELVNHTSESANLRTSAMVISKQEQYEVKLDLLSSNGEQIQRDQKVFITWGGNYLPQDVEQMSDSEKPPFAKGYVYSVAPAIDPGSRVIQVKIRTISGKEYLRDGMPVSCLIVAKERQNTLVIPKKALVFSNNQPFVFVVHPTTFLVSKRKIEKGLEGFEQVEIKTGINDKEMLITKGRYRVEEGIKVHVL